MTGRGMLRRAPATNEGGSCGECRRELMAIDTLMVYVGVYGDVADAEADYHS